MNNHHAEVVENVQSDEAAQNHSKPSLAAEKSEAPGPTKNLISELPSKIGEQIQRNPYAALGIACVAGVGAGILVGSRILRTVMSGAISYAAVEAGRAYLRRDDIHADATKPTKDRS